MEPESFAGGRYACRRLLGRGGQKVVYLVHDVALDRDCALALLDDAGEDAARLRKEAQALARMGAHPNVVTVHDIGEEGGRPYIVTEFVSGGDLEQQGPLPVERVFEVARDILTALAAIHERGVVHRDLKPSNIWLDADGRAKIGDFGLALRKDQARLTLPGTVTGTPAYVSPEQLEDREIDGRADLYSFGALLFELLCGRPPFSGSLPSIISQHLHATPPPPSRYNPALPLEIDRFVLGLLAKSPGDRPLTAKAALAALERMQEEAQRDTRPLPRAEPAAPVPPPSPAPLPSPALSSVPSRPRGARHRTIALVLAGMVVLGLGLGAAALLGRGAPEPARRVAVMATSDPLEATTATMAWALASRLVEEVDRFREFRPISPAGMLAARLSVLKSAKVVPDEAKAPELARSVRADTVAALATASAGEQGGLSVSIHVFATDDPTAGVSLPRMRVTAQDLDQQGPTRLAAQLLVALERQWNRSELTDLARGNPAHSVPFDAYKAYQTAIEYCLIGRYDQCESTVKVALRADPDNALWLSLLNCALSYQGGRDAEVVEVARRVAKGREDLTGYGKLMVEGERLWPETEAARRAGDAARATALAKRMIEIDERIGSDYGDPLGYLFAAAARQYFLDDRPGARALYARVRRLGAPLYSAYYEEAKLLYGDGNWAEGRSGAARLMWTFIDCFPDSDLNAVARADVRRWNLERPAQPASCRED
jgi:hypothetical protein